MSQPLLVGHELVLQFKGRGQPVRALDGVSFEVAPLRTTGVVGESGSGKSTLARVALKLLEPDSGELIFDGVPLAKMTTDKIRLYRRRVQAVFQDPYDSFNPRWTLLESMEEPFILHRLDSRSGARRKVIEASLTSVGLSADALSRRPHQLSGGQLQRIAIARALLLEPDVIVADEPTASLDVSVSGQVTNLLLGVQRDRGVAYLVISHNIEFIRHIADEIVVLYQGSVMEMGDAALVVADPAHPYTQLLISSVPKPDPSSQRGLGRAPAAEPTTREDGFVGCPFSPRCPLVEDICRVQRPTLRDVRGRLVACHLAEVSLGVEAISAPAIPAGGTA